MRVLLNFFLKLLESAKKDFKFSILLWLRATHLYLRDYRQYKKLDIQQTFDTSLRFAYPCLKDRLTCTPVEPTYFYQDTWAFKNILKSNPQEHLDIGSSYKTVALLAHLIPTTFVDIRTPEVILKNLKFIKADILKLPFEDCSIKSISSLCVIEHVGLGRYGDTLDPLGSEFAMDEIKRVLSPGGDLYISVPIDTNNIVYFNAHRAFTRSKFLSFFPNFKIIEEKYIYGYEMSDNYSVEKGFGTGLFWLRKL